MRGLENRTAIVTGGATLIDQGVVRAFQARGANVAVADIDAAGGQALADELGGRVLFSATDIRDDAQIEPSVVACGGSWLVKENLLRSGQFDEVERLAREALELAQRA